MFFLSICLYIIYVSDMLIYTFLMEEIMAAQKKIDEMGIEELDALTSQIEERRTQIRREEHKELMKKITIGSQVKYKLRGEEVSGEVNMMSLDYVSVSLPYPINNCNSRRLKYEEVLGIE